MGRRTGREVGDRVLGVTPMAVLMPFCNLVRMSGLGSNRKILGGRQGEVVAHAFHSRTWEAEESRPLSLRPAWST